MKSQRGGFALGLIVGLVVGLVLALGVALYVTKAPVPFMNKVPQRTPEQDAAEVERNKNWDPNAPLGGKPTQRSANPAPAMANAPATVPAPKVTPPAPVKEQPLPKNPAAILAGQDGAPPAASAPKSAKSAPEPFVYFVQAGAFARPEDAEGQRARLAMLGLAAKVTEREQSGRTVYRVRIGPFEQKGEADAAQSRLAGSGVEAALVRVER
jgi:cell division protein FtsN